MDGTQVEYAIIDNGKHGKRVIRFETGRLAQQAQGAAAVYIDGETMLFSATTASKQPKDQFDFFPLTIDVEEKMYAAGRIPGSFFRREGRPSTEAILACRLIDRPLRPSFEDGLRNEIQVVVTVMAIHPDELYDVVAINAASISTQLAGLPFSGPVGGVRVALIDGQWVAFPKHSQLVRAVFDMVVAGRVVVENGKEDVAIMMVEAEATEAAWNLIKHEGAQAPTEEIVAQGLEAAKPFIKELCEAQSRLAAKSAKPLTEYPLFPPYSNEVFAAVAELAEAELGRIYLIADKQARQDADDALKASVKEQLVAKLDESLHSQISAAYKSVTKKVVRTRVLKEKIRI
ncbi:MAG: polyribonucleotide nucleotidyltransferase, partial [Rhodoluna sp.]